MSELSAAVTGHNTLSGGAPVPAGLERAYSFADISPEDADAINAAVDIVIYGTDHALSDPSNTNPEYVAAVDAHYQGIADMVDSLDPDRGDVLYLEAALHEGKWDFLDHPWDDTQHAALIEAMRRNRTIHPWYYAAERAALRGVPVKVADMHRHVGEEFEFITGEQIDTVKYNTDHPLFPVLHALREEQAANTIAHDALATLPGLGTQKARYALLQGRAHVDKQTVTAASRHTPGTQAAFQRLGLQAGTRLIDGDHFRTPAADPDRVHAVAPYAASVALAESA